MFPEPKLPARRSKWLLGWIIILAAHVPASSWYEAHFQYNGSSSVAWGQQGFNSFRSGNNPRAQYETSYSSGQPAIPNNIIWSNQHTAGSSARHLKDQAVQRIPMRELAPDAQRKVAAVLNNTSVYRQLPVMSTPTDPDLYLFCVRYPETLLNIWQIMGVTNMSAERVGPFHLNFNDGVGTEGSVHLVYGTPQLNVYYGEGVYEGPLLMRRVHGQCVLVLSTEYYRDDAGKSQARSQLDVFLKIDHLTASLIARTVHPLVGSTADHNFVESLRFLERLSETAEENPEGMQRLARRLNNVRPEVRHRFDEIIEVIAWRSESHPRTTVLSDE